MRKFLRSDLFLGLALALFAFCVYLKTLSPTIVPEDCGELATALYTLGIPHPTGYPLFALIGWAVSHLPLGGRVILKLNVMVAVFCAAAVFFFFRLFLFLLSDKVLTRWKDAPAPAVSRKGKKNPVPAASGAFDDRIAAGVTVLVLAFSTTFWTEALSLEVYALHLVFLSLATLLFLETLSEHARNPNSNRGWPLFAYVLGLSFANHMMTVLLAPAFLYLYFAVHGLGRPAWIKIGRAVPPFLLALTAYLYLPIRALRHPLMNWGDPSSLHRLWFHVSAAQFHDRMFSSFAVAEAKSQAFLANYPSEFGYAPLLLALVGIWSLYRHSRRMLAFSILVFFGCLLYSVNYNFDDPNYYLNAYAATAVWIAFGVREILGRAALGRARWIVFAACAALALLPLGLHYRAADQSRNYLAEDYVKNILGSLDSGAVLVSDDEKPLLFPAYYFQAVEGFRPDVAVLNMSLLWLPWYYDHLECLHPELVRRARPQIDSFFGEERNFEARYYGHGDSWRDAALDSTRYAARYLDVVQTFLWKEGRSAYATKEVSLTPNINKIADGMVFRIFTDNVPRKFPLKEFSFRPLSRSDSLAEAIRLDYASGYANQGLYRALVLGDTATGIVFLRKSLEVKPDFPAVSDWLARLEKRN